MIRRTALNALAAAAAALAFGTPAEAGGGVRLTFGGPLPSFVATPTPGYGGATSAHRKASPKLYAAKRRQPAHTAVAARHAQPKAERPLVRVRHTPTSSAPKVVPSLPVTANDGENPGFIGRTLALDNLPRAETIHALLPTETIVAEDAPEIQSAAAAPAAAPAETSSKVAAAAGPTTCRKFIPAVGVTVTVACD